MKGDKKIFMEMTSEDVMAATFNKDLVYRVGKVVGEDCLAAKVAILSES